LASSAERPFEFDDFFSIASITKESTMIASATHRSRRFPLAAGLSAITAVLVFAAAAPAQSVELRYRLETGKTYELTSAEKQTLEQDMGGFLQTQVTDSATTYAFHVDGVDGEGNYQITVTIKAMSTKVEGPGGSMEFDSAADAAADNGAGMLLRAAVGKPFKIVMNSRGGIVKAEGLLESLRPTLAGANAADPLVQGAMMMIEHGLSEEALRGALTIVIPQFPEGRVAAGESWTSEHNLKMGVMRSAVDLRSELESAGADRVKVKQTTNVQPAEGAEPIDLPGGAGIKLNVQLLGEASGWVELDAKTGWMVSGETSSEMKGVSEVFGGPIPQPMQIPTTLKVSGKVSGKVGG
jgi:hypothetical protein